MNFSTSDFLNSTRFPIFTCGIFLALSVLYSVVLETCRRSMTWAIVKSSVSIEPEFTRSRP